MSENITDPLKRKIYMVIDKHGSLGFIELFNIVVHDRKICSEKPFRERLKELVEDRLVIRKDAARGKKVLYYTLRSYENERKFIETIEKDATTLKHQAKFLQTKFEKLTTYQKTLTLLLMYAMSTLVRSKIEMLEKEVPLDVCIDNYSDVVLDVNEILTNLSNNIGIQYKQFSLATGTIDSLLTDLSNTFKKVLTEG